MNVGKGHRSCLLLRGKGLRPGQVRKNFIVIAKVQTREARHDSQGCAVELIASVDIVMEKGDAESGARTTRALWHQEKATWMEPETDEDQGEQRILWLGVALLQFSQRIADVRVARENLEL